jgi:hypothetical protein
MQMTFHIDDGVMAPLKREAERQGHTMLELLEVALLPLLRSNRRRKKIVALQTFCGGNIPVDISDREAVYHPTEAAR